MAFFAFVAVALKPDHFEGMRFDFTKMITPYFALSHRYVPGASSCFVSLLRVLAVCPCFHNCCAFV